MPSSSSIAIVAADGVFTYGDLDAISARVAAALVRIAGARTRDLEERRVAFRVPPSFAYVTIQRAIWRAGGIAVPLAVSHPPAELDYVVRDAGASIVVGGGVHGAELSAIAAAAGAQFFPTADLLASDDEEWSDPALSSERRALIVYTSGTTGRAKGVVTTHGTLRAQVSALVEAWEWSAADTALLALPLHHVHGIVNVLGCANGSGAACHILPQFDAESVWERLASGEISVFSAVPTMYTRLIQSWDAADAALRRHRSAGASRVRLMMSGSSPLPVATLERWREITGQTLLERYGMTEIGMALSNPLHGTRRAGFVGAPLPGVDVRIVGDTGNLVPEGVAGALEVRGPAVFREYWRRPEETRAAFRGGWFRTGDVAIVEDGAYRLLGRESIDIIKTGGYKVSAIEIENALRTHPSIRDCAVVGVADEAWGERVAAVVELCDATGLQLDPLREWLRDRLAPYKLPTVLHQLDRLPRNAMGKIDKARLRMTLERDRI
ncbi:MAG TPA: acyl-CoA synthetase [Vicinamibacterales bacterium]|jgi:malonyl-CoA/methylmalonyl-CoA synthetase